MNLCGAYCNQLQQLRKRANFEYTHSYMNFGLERKENKVGLPSTQTIKGPLDSETEFFSLMQKDTRRATGTTGMTGESIEHKWYGVQC